MGMNEDIAELNKRLSSLAKTQDEAKKMLAVQEHKLGELTTSLEAEGYDVANMTEEQIAALVVELTDKFHSTKETIEDKLSEVEKLFAKLEEINQKS